MTLTRISLVTAAVTAAVNLVVLFGVDLSAEQIAGINTLLLAVGAAVHSWFNPAVPIGPKPTPEVKEATP